MAKVPKMTDEQYRQALDNAERLRETVRQNIAERERREAAERAKRES